MLENGRRLLAFCAVCGAIGSYFISLYILVLAFVACIYILVSDSKLLGQVVSAARDFTFPVSSWIKSVITSLMNSYHLSKPPEPEPNQRRNSSYSPNLPIPRRPSCRSGRFTCLDENTDYGNRRNGIGLCSPNTSFNNSYTNSIHGFRRQSGFSDADNSSKTEEFATPQTSPWGRRQNYSGNEFSSVRRVQTVAGPLLATSGLTKRKSSDFGLYVDANSPGLASRIVQYREDVTSGATVWTHQPQYGSPGQFPMVHLSHSPSSLPVLSPLSSQKASRRSVRVKIAPPDPLGSRLYTLSTKNNASYTSTLADHSTKSVLETLKEISRKRIHSQLEDQDDDAVKRQKRNAPSDVLVSQGTDIEGENMSKRLREESPRQPELSPPARPAKRVRNNEILSSLSSSRKLLQGGSMKRKTHNLDWSRCSTPVLGKQQKTVDDEEINTVSSSCGQNASEKSSPLVTPSMLSQALQKKEKKTSESEKTRSNSLLLIRPPNSGIKIPNNKLQVTPVTPKSSQKGPIVPVDDTPWQKDSPFVSVSSPDDIIDDISALEEKREEDRRSRLMSMMTVISGGEPPMKMPAPTEYSGAISSEKSTFTSTFTLSNSSLTAPTSSNNLPSNISPEKASFGTSTLSSNWSSSSTILLAPAACTTSENPNPSIPVITSSGTPIINSPSFNFGTSSVPVSSASVVLSNNIDTSMSSTSPVISTNIVPLFETPTQLTSQQTPAVSSPLVFGSAQSLFGPIPTTSSENVNVFSSQPQLTESLTASNKSGENVSFSIGNSVSFGVPKLSVTQPTTSVTTTVTPTAVTSTSTSIFKLQPAASGLDQENAVSSSSGFVSSTSTVEAGTSSVQTNIFSKTTAFGAPEKSTSLMAPGMTVFGSPVTTTSISSPVFASTTTSTPSDSQIKPGLFSFGGSSGSSSNSQAVTSSNAKLVFGNTTGAFGQALETSGNDTTSSQSSHSATNNKVGGFKFNLSNGKALFSNQSNVSSSETTNVFGNPNSTTVTTNSESKPFAFGSSKPVENTFTLSTSNSNSTATSSQIQTSGNIFGSSALQQKQGESDKSKENLFSFGGSATASPVFAAPQLGSFGAQPTTAPTTTTTTGFSFSSAAPSGFSQLSSGTGGFSMQANATSSASFATPSTTATVANTAFTFGSNTSNQTSQSNMFNFGASSTTTDLQSSNMFAFGSSNSPASSSGTGLFGQPAPVATIQPQAVPTQTPGQAPAATASPPQAFQFGTTNNSQQISGAFSFGSSSNASAPPSGFPSSGSFQVNTGGFGSGPAMFSIGSGTTAPRVRNTRTRRTK